MKEKLFTEKNLSIASKIADVALLSVSLFLTIDLLDKNITELKKLLNNK